jgi:hypothetical protein
MSMRLAVLDVPVEEARAKLKVYQDAVKKDHRDIDRRIADGYRHLAQGRSLINLPASIERGGFNEDGMPRLAVAGAIWRFVHVACDAGWGGARGRQLVYAERRLDDLRSASLDVSDNYVRVLLKTEHELRGEWRRWRAIVPMVPPEHRHHAIRGSFGSFHILFEAEWQINPDPPRDPALIKHLAGDLWAVYAVWDLTELERAVLGGR